MELFSMCGWKNEKNECKKLHLQIANSKNIKSSAMNIVENNT